MSKKLSVEEALRQKMNDLPLPDENESWLKMKALLDEKEKRKPFVFFRSGKLAGGIMLLLLLGLWLMIAPEKIQQPASTATETNSVHKEEKMEQNGAQETAGNESSMNRITANAKDSLAGFLSSNQSQQNSESVSSEVNYSGHKSRKRMATVKSPTVRTNLSAKLNSDDKNRVRNDKPKSDNQDEKKDSSREMMVPTYFNKPNKVTKVTDSSESFANANKSDDSSLAINLKDSSSQAVAKDSLQQAANNNEAASATKKLITIKKHNSFFVDAGIELKQQLPVSNQRITYYNYNGNQTLLPDYLPSVYVKLEKEKRWFVQGEFSYASSRLPKDFIYLQKTNADYAHSSITVTTYHLQKTYYTQVPVSFNLYVHSSLSVGAGVMYSWLQGAVAKQEVATGISPFSLQTITEQRLPIKGFTDSFLYKTQTSLLLQAAYEKNKWSFGLRYLQDVQPFITYTLPNGEKNDKRNASLELIIRYRLFRSSKFSLKTK